MDTQQIAALLKKYHHLIEDYLELINDNERFADLIMMLREILSHSLNELSAYFSPNDRDRPIVSYLQATLPKLQEGYHQLEKHHHNTLRRTEHLTNICSTLTHTIEHLEPLLQLTNIPVTELDYLNQIEPKLSFLSHECTTAAHAMELETLDLNYITSNLLNITRRMEDAKLPEALLQPQQTLVLALDLSQTMMTFLCAHIAEHLQRLRLRLDIPPEPWNEEKLKAYLRLEAQLKQLQNQRLQEELTLQNQKQQEELALQNQKRAEEQAALSEVKSTAPTLAPQLTPWTGSGHNGEDK